MSKTVSGETGPPGEARVEKGTGTGTRERGDTGRKKSAVIPMSPWTKTPREKVSDEGSIKGVT